MRRELWLCKDEVIALSFTALWQQLTGEHRNASYYVRIYNKVLSIRIYLTQHSTLTDTRSQLSSEAEILDPICRCENGLKNAHIYKHFQIAPSFWGNLYLRRVACGYEIVLNNKLLFNLKLPNCMFRSHTLCVYSNDTNAHIGFISCICI